MDQKAKEKKIRVYELGKKLGIGSKELMGHLEALGIGVKSHMSTLDAESAAAVEDALKPEKKEKLKIILRESVSAGDLARKAGVKPNELIQKLMAKGLFVSINDKLNRSAVETASKELGFDVEFEKSEPKKPQKPEEKAKPEKEENLAPRPPIVAVMGHVDHGKTLLLDAIRKTNVAEGEAGGITQQIGASTIELKEGRIVFIDTPGHEAFTSMRERGAQVTDIVVLVVAADDGVMPQTVEAIHHAKEAGVTIIAAINKTDKPEADPQRVKIKLQEYGLVPEEYGGDTICVELSALKNKGVDELLEMLLLQAELLELKANPEGPAEGTVIEAKLDKKRGPVASIVIRKGMLKTGDSFVVGEHGGKVRAMFTDTGKSIKAAGPSTPVEIIGFTGVPLAGDTFKVVESEKKSREISAGRQLEKREESLAGSSQVSLEDLLDQVHKGDVKELNLIIRTDTQGAAEALVQSLEKLGNESVKVRVIFSQTGQITESDIMLASASNAVILGFNAGVDNKAKELNKDKKVDIRLYGIIYEAIKEIRQSLEGMLAPKFVEVSIGKAEIRKVFKTSKGNIAGSYVLEGKLVRNAPAKVIRNGEEIFRSSLSSLKRFKNDAREVESGFECGLNIANFDEFEEGDIIEVFKTVAEKTTF
jgi:translation initiation factor IF-2